MIAGFPATVRARYTTRVEDGLSVGPYHRCNLATHVGDEPRHVGGNRALLQRSLPSAPRYLRQVHGTHVAHFDAVVGDEPEADASVTRTPGVVLAILTADCLPVLIAAADGSVVGAAHAGWRGLAAGVVERTLEAMAHDPAGLVAWIGPAISRAAYEVGEDVRAAMLSVDERGADAFEPTRPGHYRCDLPALAEQRLRRAGVGHVIQSGICTHADPRFYSYRRDGVTGRFASLVWIEP